MRKRVAVSYSAANGFYVALPSYVIERGSWAPLTDGVIDANGVAPAAIMTNGAPDLVKIANVLGLAPSVMVVVPDEWFDKNGAYIGDAALRAMYQDHPTFGQKAYAPPAMAPADK